MSEFQIHQYDSKTGWSKVDSPVPDGGDDKLAAAGFRVYATAGVEGGFRLLIFSGPGNSFLLLMDGIDGSVEEIFLPDLPSMIDLVYKLTPMALAGQLEGISAFTEDVQELLVGEHGPLQEAQRARWRRRRAEAAIVTR